MNPTYSGPPLPMTAENNLRTANWRRATEGAKATREARAANLRRDARMRAALADRHTDLRSPAEIALLALRTDIAAGVPHKALLDRVDDEIFKLKRGPKP